MLDYSIRAVRRDHHGSLATCKQAELEMDTDPAGGSDAFNPAELLLAAVAACMLKNLERVAPMLTFRFSSAEVRVHAVREDHPPRLTRIDYEIVLDTDEPDRRLELMHENIRKYGTIFNTIAAVVELTGTLSRRAPAD
ncbi:MULTISPECIES: OsmC family protein [unclassified Acidocella]|uniref:OsmC family protein n=1 Tax=unclassified Acidocella TaxID=2648610 RepID=UPI00028CDE2D|nr:MULTISPECIES: OsmC family protein [unclassified Acidocella]EKM98169.1 OsmC family protein [Acidocella sp. MX-AZ02]WBO59390.1 OsmC family protein [Acidocella sp. MX-AZ03]